MNNKVCILGLWHLGSVNAACLAESGYKVTGFDEDPKIVASLQNGKATIFEPGLDDLIKKNLKNGKLKFFSSLKDAIRDCKIAILTNDTPLDDNDDVDLSGVFRIIENVVRYTSSDLLLIVQSQVPVGTCEKILNFMNKINSSHKFEIAYVPENLRLGKAIEIFTKPDRIVLGSDNADSLSKVEKFYSFIDRPVLKMDLKSAEMSKHTINAFLANCISFINEIGNLCEVIGADVLMVTKSLTTESRIGNKLPLMAGLGFAGGTLARDLQILKKLNVEHNMKPRMIEAILQTNYEQNIIAITKLQKIFDKLSGLQIGIFGLTYKPGTNTLRRSSAIEMISILLKQDVSIKAYDPSIHQLDVFDGKKFKLVSNEYDAADQSDVLLLLTEWPQFKETNYEKICSLMKKPVFIDAKNFLDPDSMRKIGFDYHGIGRK